MVLWEITAATAYFLGLKKTYKLALRIQRRLIGPKHPRIRGFLHRRTRAVFDMALTVHRNIQERDLEVGRSLGTRILRFLDKMKPSANIRGSTGEKLLPPRNTTMTSGNIKNGTQKSAIRKPNNGSSEQGSSGRHLFSAARNTWHRSFPTITMMMQPDRITGTGTSTTQFRQLSANRHEAWRFSRQGDRLVGGIRPDILMWMQMK